MTTETTTQTATETDYGIYTYQEPWLILENLGAVLEMIIDDGTFGMFHASKPEVRERLIYTIQNDIQRALVECRRDNARYCADTTKLCAQIHQLGGTPS